MQDQIKLFLAIGLVVFISGVVLLGPAPTGYQAAADTTKPSVSVSGPASVDAGNAVAITATAYDNRKVYAVTIYVDNAIKKICTINAASGSCTFSGTFAEGVHTYYALARDAYVNEAKTATNTFTVGRIATVSLSSKDVYKRTTLGLKTPSLTFYKEYKNVVKIDFEGIPGGDRCGAAVQIEAIDGYGAKVGKFTTGRVDAHKTATKSVLVNNLNIRKVTGSTVPDKDWVSWDCGVLDYLKVTLTYKITT